MKTIIFTVFVLIGAAAASPQGDCKRYNEPLKGLSICVPAGFSIEENPGGPFKKFFSRANGSNSNVNILTETTTRSLDAYAASQIKEIFRLAQSNEFQDFRLIGFVDIATNAGAKGLRMEFTSLYKGVAIRSIQYYFQRNPNEIIVITATTTQENTAVPSSSDAAVKTLVLKP